MLLTWVVLVRWALEGLVQRSLGVESRVPYIGGKAGFYALQQTAQDMTWFMVFALETNQKAKQMGCHACVCWMWTWPEAVDVITMTVFPVIIKVQPVLFPVVSDTRHQASVSETPILSQIDSLSLNHQCRNINQLLYHAGQKGHMLPTLCRTHNLTIPCILVNLLPSATLCKLHKRAILKFVLW